MDTQVLTVLVILLGVMVLLATEWVRIDVTAILCLLALGWTGVLTPSEALGGFSSHAVIAMMAVMIMGRGIAVTGIMDRFARVVSKHAGGREHRVTATLSAAVGLLSGFIQNIGAAALFLPGAMGVARRTRISPSRIIMPMGFAAILGGTLSMVGSGPLILVNDLLQGAGLKPYALLSVTPVGIVLLVAGILYFLILGKFVLPKSRSRKDAGSIQQQLIEALHIPSHIRHYVVPSQSPLVGRTSEQSKAWQEYRVNFLGVSRRRGIQYAPCRNTRFSAGQVVVILGESDDIHRFAGDYGLQPRRAPAGFAGLGDPVKAGFAEVIIPPRSEMVGHSIREYSLRRRFAVEPVMLSSRGKEIRGDFSDHRIMSGDTLVVYGLWEKIAGMQVGSDFVVATPFQVERTDREKSLAAAGCFLAAVALAMAGFPISLSFLTGAVAMVLTRVLKIQEAYQAIEWKVVFLLAGLIPLGQAMQATGTAAFLADSVMKGIQDMPLVILVAVVALMATLFSLFMSNVGSIVVLAPLVIAMAEMGGIDPRPMVLLAAVSAANSFMLPTHQVNAMLISAGGYRNADYLKAGGGMTVLFLLVVVPLFALFYL